MQDHDARDGLGVCEAEDRAGRPPDEGAPHVAINTLELLRRAELPGVRARRQLGDDAAERRIVCVWITSGGTPSEPTTLAAVSS